ncbi:hypothetical protein B0T16DRAFT_403874 [Cercophora newfieldiana]|uniref:Uncharacterized protein n=1 Tax=Cercophora newfieldiana TaxID=92897 RepID=A0AA40CUS2_9PEZI|nr:hypothetical protein B0T16DRAFT_403874 [Cercophora newfieldiana]
MSSQNRPPTAPNMADILNRINMGISHQAKILSSLNRPSPSPASTSTPTTSTTTGKSFSSLSSKPLSSTSSNPFNTSQNTTTTAANNDDNDDLNPSYLLAPNTGVGFTPTPSAASLTAEQRSLRDRLAKVGWKGGRGGAGKGSDGKKRPAAAVDSESEEELGRSAVGKARSRVQRDVSGGEGNGKSEEGGKGKAELQVAIRGVESAEKEVKGREGLSPEEDVKEGVEMVTATGDVSTSASGETQAPDGEAKAKKKKKNKKKKAKKQDVSTES